MSLESFMYYLLYTFLFLFALSSILSLLSLPNWVNIPQPFKGWLYKAFIAQIAGSLISIMAGIVSGKWPPPQYRKPVLNTHELIQRHWDWQWTEGNWATKAVFEEGDTGLTFKATTYYVRNDWKKPKIEEEIADWYSTKRITINRGDSEIVFPAMISWLDAAEQYFYISKRGKLNPVMIRIKLSNRMHLDGTWKFLDEAKMHDIYLTEER